MLRISILVSNPTIIRSPHPAFRSAPLQCWAARAQEDDESRHKRLTLHSCLAAFTKEEQLDEMYCSRCREHQAGTKRMDLWRLPPVLVIQVIQARRRREGPPVRSVFLVC